MTSWSWCVPSSPMLTSKVSRVRPKSSLRFLELPTRPSRWIWGELSLLFGLTSSPLSARLSWILSYNSERRGLLAHGISGIVGLKRFCNADLKGGWNFGDNLKKAKGIRKLRRKETLQVSKSIDNLLKHTIETWWTIVMYFTLVKLDCVVLCLQLCCMLLNCTLWH